MEPYRAYGRGSYNRSMNSCCNQNRNMGNQSRNMCNQNRLGCVQERQSDSCAEPTIMSVKSKTVNNNNCECKDENPHLRHFTLGMGYVPMQEWGDMYDLETGFCEGTMFPDLNFVFCGARGKM